MSNTFVIYLKQEMKDKLDSARPELDGTAKDDVSYKWKYFETKHHASNLREWHEVAFPDQEISTQLHEEISNKKEVHFKGKEIGELRRKL